MKQKFRRFMAGFLAILTMFTTLFTNGTTAFAASSSANISFWYASAKDHGVISEFNSNHKGGSGGITKEEYFEWKMNCPDLVTNQQEIKKTEES